MPTEMTDVCLSCYMTVITLERRLKQKLYQQELETIM